MQDVKVTTLVTAIGRKLIKRVEYELVVKKYTALVSAKFKQLGLLNLPHTTLVDTIASFACPLPAETKRLCGRRGCFAVCTRCCGKCCKVYYCSKRHQSKDWRKGGHKEVCVDISDLWTRSKILHPPSPMIYDFGLMRTGLQDRITSFF